MISLLSIVTPEAEVVEESDVVDVLATDVVGVDVVVVVDTALTTEIR
jgi:hypothetical protein